MSMTVTRLPTRARNIPPKNSVQKRTLKTGDSFAAMCRDVLGKDAGYQLSRLTGYPESTCYRYAAGQTVPPIDFIARLFNTEVGEPFFEWFVQDIDAKWWTQKGAKCHRDHSGRLSVTRSA
jgi:hypothetical protein